MSLQSTAGEGAGLLAGQGVQVPDTAFIEQVHHAVDLWQGHLHAEVALQGAHAGPFAFGAGEPCYLTLWNKALCEAR